jgi:hypothetical protein
MLVFSYGIPGSGSTLAFELAKAVARLGGHSQRKLPAALLPGPHKVNFAENLTPEALRAMAALAEGHLCVVKTHACPGPDWVAEYRTLAARGLVSAHVNHRDPRDICLSLLDSGRLARVRGVQPFSEYVILEDAVARVKRYLAELAVWSGLPQRLDLHYEDCAFRVDRAIEAIKADFGIACPNWPARLWVTRLAFTHRNKAMPNRHLAELTPTQAAWLHREFAAWLPA